MAMAKAFIPLGELPSAQGRINRLQYLVYGWGSNILLIGISLAGSALVERLNNLYEFDHETRTLIIRGAIIATVIFALVVLFVLFCASAKRLHDIGLPAIVALLMFGGSVSDAVVTFGNAYLPLEGDAADIISVAGYGAALLLLLALSVWPGQAGENRYGPSPQGEQPPKGIVEG